jgi:hypothetical protein
MLTNGDAALPALTTAALKPTAAPSVSSAPPRPRLDEGPRRRAVTPDQPSTPPQPSHGRKKTARRHGNTPTACLSCGSPGGAINRKYAPSSKTSRRLTRDGSLTCVGQRREAWAGIPASCRRRRGELSAVAAAPIARQDSAGETVDTAKKRPLASGPRRRGTIDRLRTFNT